MKSLYAILRVHPKATAEEIDAAYRQLSAEIEPGGHLANEGMRSRLVALREAYHVLGDPAARQMYDQKLALTIAGASPAAPKRLAEEYAEPRNSLPLLKIALAGAIAIGGLVIYTHHVKEQDRQRIEAAQAVVDKALELEKEKQRMAEVDQAARLERQQRLDDASLDERTRYESQQALREANYRSQQSAREDEARRRQEAYEQQRQESAAATRRNQELREAQMRAAREKQAAQQLDRQKYGLSY